MSYPYSSYFNEQTPPSYYHFSPHTISKESTKASAPPAPSSLTNQENSTPPICPPNSCVSNNENSYPEYEIGKKEKKEKRGFFKKLFGKNKSDKN
ncbi:unnamed protein product [Caenorhabditis angaria]|uniref:Uncharacterized protein n=1 Tax=Caenorhabditis angaria TaxID=860376 RepID=A0A9P1J6R4_9PELO|nr:unnamed protein product [Caenorhabditis angaria]